MQTPDDSHSEGAFGMFSHGATVRSIQTDAGKDYDFWSAPTPGVLNIDALAPTSTHRAVSDAYR